MLRGGSLQQLGVDEAKPTAACGIGELSDHTWGHAAYTLRLPCWNIEDRQRDKLKAFVHRFTLFLRHLVNGLNHVSGICFKLCLRHYIMASAHIYGDSVKRAGSGSEFSLLFLPDCKEIGQITALEYIDRYKTGCLAMASQQEPCVIVDSLIDWGLCQ
ncbi:MAG: hypothetical protein RLN85_14555 [Pseudomonadales bacterium]